MEGNSTEESEELGNELLTSIGSIKVKGGMQVQGGKMITSHFTSPGSIQAEKKH